MGVAQTSEIYKGFIFDGIDSKGFGVYITGSGVYNAPERDVELIEIPGRNGSFVQDKGRFHNVTVAYPAGLFGDNEDDFAEGIRKLRNALASRRGYCKLVDEYHPNEYRMAMYRGGLEVDPAAINGENVAAQFEIQFECKPQRFLIQGDEPVKVANGGKVYNPTLFEAKPLLKVWGYGDISINDETISIIDEVIGDITLANGVQGSTTSFPTAQLNSGDRVTLQSPPSYNAYANMQYTIKFEQNVDEVTAAIQYGETAVSRLEVQGGEDTNFAYLYLWLEPFVIEYLTTTRATENIRIELTVKFTEAGVAKETVIYYEVSVLYADAQFQIFANRTTDDPIIYSDSKYLRLGAVTAYSTKSVLGEPLFFDLDIGEAYKEEGSEVVSVNGGVSFGAELPALVPSENTITFDDTVTKLEIIPRWWEV